LFDGKTNSSFFAVRAYMPTWLHAFVQDPHDFYQTRPNYAVKEDMHRPSHLRLGLAGTRISEMKAADPARQFHAVPGRRTFWFSCDFAHPGSEDRGIAALASNSPTLDARSKNLRKVSPRQQRETKARHAGSASAFARCGRQPFKKPVKLGIVDFNEISPVERIDTDLYLRAERFQFQRIFLSPLLEHAERVTHRFARILILARLHDTFDEGVLLGSQADVTSRHVRISLKIRIGYQPWQSLPMPSYAAAYPLRQRAAQHRPE
jgi:hypothetical protein